MDLYGFLDPIMFVSRLFGLTPIIVVEDKNTGYRKYKLSNYWIIYSVSFISLFTVFQIVSICTCEVLTEEKVMRNSFEFVSLTNLIFSDTIAISSLFFSKDLVQIASKLSLINSNFCNTNLTVNSRLLKKFISYFSVLIVVSLLFGTLIFLSNFSHFVYTNVFFSISISVDITLMILPYLQFILFITELKDNFRVINYNLSNVNSKSLGFINHSRNLPPKSCSRVKLLSSAHNTLVEVARTLNRAYSVQLLVSMLISLIQLVFCSYTILRIVVYLGATVLRILEMSILMVWVALFLIKLTVLSWMCNQTTSEVSQTNLLSK